jgi:hypothetical protein
MNETCEKCGAVEASPYSFHYGRFARTTDYTTTPWSSGASYGTQSTWTEHYQVGGSTLPICATAAC